MATFTFTDRRLGQTAMMIAATLPRLVVLRVGGGAGRVKETATWPIGLPRLPITMARLLVALDVNLRFHRADVAQVVVWIAALTYRQMMPKFYMHVINDLGFSEDEQGLELPDLEAARIAADVAIRELIAEDIVSGRNQIHITVEIVDAAGEPLLKLPASVTVEGLDGRAG